MKTRISLLTAGTRKEDILAAKGQVLLAKAHLKQSIIGLRKHDLFAPISGVIASVPVEQGDVITSVPAPKTIVEILKISPILFECSVSELFIPYLSKSTTAKIRIDAFPGELFIGSFLELVPKGNLNSRTFTVRFSIKNGDKKLKPGMFARSTITLSTFDNVLTIPVSILREPSSIENTEGTQVHFTNETKYYPSREAAIIDINKLGYKAVMTSKNGVAAARLIKTGFITGKYVEIKSGLSTATKIITEGFAELKIGMKLNDSKGSF
jgi:multidrug efflux pump subunit AcrA (membrane-fusion protein)